MPIARRASLSILATAVALGLLAAPAALAADGGASASKGGKKCPPGKKVVSVVKKGKKTKVCKPKKKKKKAAAPQGPQAPTAQPLFEAPGKQLNGEETKPFLQKYLANSTFTDCVAGWPSCGGFENRYSHSASGTFYQCWLRPTSGSDVKSVGEYGFKDARVEPDGSWIFKELVYWYEHYSLFEWSVSASGVVRGAQLSDSGGPPEQIGPLQYVGGVAKDCSY